MMGNSKRNSANAGQPAKRSRAPASRPNASPPANWAEEKERLLAQLRELSEQCEAANARIREQAREIEEKSRALSALVEAMPAGVLVVDSAGRITLSNAAAKEILGTEISGNIYGFKGNFTLHHIDGSPIPPEKLPLRIAIEKGKTTTGLEMLVRRGDGTERLVLAAASPVHNSGGQIVAGVAVFQDITEQKRVQKDISLLAAIVESSQDAIIGMDLEGIISDWNPAAERLYGYSAEEVLGRCISIVIPPERRDELKRTLASIWQGKPVTQIETVRMRKNGKRIDVSMSASPIKDKKGQIIGVSWIARDISEIKRLDEIRRQASELETILASIADGVLVSDKEGRIVRVNRAGVQLLGFSSEDEMLRPFFELMDKVYLRHPNGQPVKMEETAYYRALRGEVVREYEEIARQVNTGRDVNILVTAAPMRDEEGNVIGVVEVLSDITRIRELDKLKDEFIGVAAHELKTPIAIMKGYAQALLKAPEPGSMTTRRMLEAINRGADRIDRIVKDLLDISRLHLGHLELTREKITLPELVEEVVNVIALTTTKHTIRVVKAEPVVVEGDRDRIEQVLANLIDNAIKYSPMGGNIDIAIDVRDREAVVLVKDYGVGIPKERQGHIFERFYRAHTGTPYDYGGMGVGLYISKEIVTRHGGRIWFESEEGKGSTFYFSLPLA